MRKYVTLILSIVALFSVVFAEKSNENLPQVCTQQQIFMDYLHAQGDKATSAACPNGHICDLPEERAKFYYDTLDSPTFIKLFITVVREDDSTNPATTPAIIEAQINQLNNDYLPYGFQFEYKWRYFESSYYRSFPAPSFFSLDLMRQLMYVDPDSQFNIIVTELTNPGNSYTTNPTLFDPQGLQSGIVMSTFLPYNQWSSDLTRHTLTHEFGHVFGLIHTYWGYSDLGQCGHECSENLGTGPSDYTGDRCSDTDPEIWWGNPTFAGAIDTCNNIPWPANPNKNFLNAGNNKDNGYLSNQQAARTHCYKDFYWKHIITGVVMDADVKVGKAPLTVNFSATSDKNVSDWSWDFGDGNTADIQNPQNEYLDPGIYRVESAIQSDDGPYNHYIHDFIAVHDDTLKVVNTEASPDDTVLVPIYMNNFIPVTGMTIPIVMNGSMNVTVLDAVLNDARVDSALFGMINYDSFNKRYTIQINPFYESPIEPDTGAIAYLKVFVPSGAPDSVTISVQDYSSYVITNELYEYLYSPTTLSGILTRTGCCENIRGNVDGDALDQVDISDLVYYVDYSFGNPQGDAPSCFEESDVDNNGSLDIADIVYLVSYMFTSGPAPLSCS